ncbi:MAG: hypothetical protein ACKO24_13890, partial [Leptolyngbyaceae cyanobacterium]
LFLTIYLAVLALFLFRIVQAFNDEYLIDKKTAEDKVRANLEQQKLQQLVEIGFEFEKRYEFAKKNILKNFTINITNKSGSEQPQRYAIYVDWDRCTLTDLENRSRRVIRCSPGKSIDLSQGQTSSTIAAGTFLKETITAEDTLTRKGERKDDKLPTESPMNLVVEITKPMIDLTPEKPSDSLKQKLKSFKSRKPDSDLSFSLDLALRVVGPDTPEGGKSYRIPCQFMLKKLSWKVGLPWNPKSG